MNKLITIDPGKTIGLACFESGELVSVDEHKPKRLLDAARFIALCCPYIPFDLAIELPQVYPVQRWKGDPNDLITVALQAGVILGAVYAYIATLYIIKPSEWKGSTPKAISKERTLAKLTAGERAHVQKKSSTHIMDAIGLGLWILNR